MVLLGVEVGRLLLPSIALSDIFHEVSIIHSVSHLCLIMLTFLRILRISESSNSGLIEHLLLLIHLAVDMWKHLMDS